MDLARCDLLLRLAGQAMPRSPWLRSLWIEGAVRSFEPTACQLPFMNIAGKLPLALAHRTYRCVGSDVFERYDPVRIVLVDSREQDEHRRSGDQHVLRQRIGHIAQGLHHVGL